MESQDRIPVLFDVHDLIEIIRKGRKEINPSLPLRKILKGLAEKAKDPDQKKELAKLEAKILIDILLEHDDIIEKQIDDTRSWQCYDQSISIDGDSFLPVGLVKAYGARDNIKILENLNQITAFPHFYSSFYGAFGDDPDENRWKRNTPFIYRSEHYENSNYRYYNNIGFNCFVKSWDDFMMFVGWPDTIIRDISVLVDSAKRYRGLWNGHDMVTDLHSPFYNESELTNEYLQKIKQMRLIYADLGDQYEYSHFMDKIEDIITSVIISTESKQKLESWDKKGLIPVCPMNIGGALGVLKDYGWDQSKGVKADYMGMKFPIYAVAPPVYAYKSGGFYDSETNHIIGKPKQIFDFLRFLHQENILDEKDLRYLI
jgi:hypothetical protein